MDLNKQLIEKYNIVYIKGNRYYKVDLKIKDYFFENTTPIYAKIENEDIFDSSWKNMLHKIFMVLDKKCFKTDEELLNIKYTWSKQEFFTRKKKSNHFEIRDGLYINCNNTAVHSMWAIQILLSSYNVDLNDAVFIIRRSPSSEPSEIKQFFSNRVKNDFSFILEKRRNLSKEKINSIISTIEKINDLFLKNISPSYNDFFLIEEPLYFYNFMNKVNEAVKKDFRISESKKNTIKVCLSLLFEYVKDDKNYRKKNIDDYFEAESKEKNIDLIIDELLNFEDLL